MHPTLNIAVKAARRAGGIINRASRDVEQIKVQTRRHYPINRGRDWFGAVIW